MLGIFCAKGEFEVSQRKGGQMQKQIKQKMVLKKGQKIIKEWKDLHLGGWNNSKVKLGGSGLKYSKKREKKARKHKYISAGITATIYPYKWLK